MPRPATLLPLVACCLPFSGCFGCILGSGDDLDDPGVCYQGEDLPKAPEGSTIQVRGSAARADGTPLTDTVLMRDPATGNDILGAIFTLGLSCLKEDLSGLDCGEWRKLTPDAQGRFSLTYPEEQTHGFLFDKTFDFFAAAPAPPSGLDGAAMVITAWFSNAEVEVPMKLWEPEVHVVERDGKVQVSATPLIPTSTCAPADDPEMVFSTADGAEAWTGKLGSFDARVLEDFDGRVTVSTSVRYIHSQVGAGLYTSAAQAFQGSSGPAPSRGAACSAGGATYAPGECPFTDGKWAESQLAGGLATVDLGADQAVSLVALRGHFSNAQLSVAEDGKAWKPVRSEITGRSVTIEMPAGTVARYLKVAEPFDAVSEYQPVLSLKEVSAW